MQKKFKLILIGLILMMFTGGVMAVASLSGGGIDPATGTIGTSFNFTVNYTDTDNLSANYVNVTIDGTPYSMSETDPSDTNTSDGKGYFYSASGFTVGDHNYDFDADNGNGSVSFGVGTFTITNSAPVLSSMGVSPSSGSPTTNFEFTATYTDADNNESSYVNVTIDGVSYAMTGDSANPEDGKVYTYNSTFPLGTHVYNFTASDGVTAVGPIGDGSFVVNSESSLSGSISPTSGAPDDIFYFNATFTDGDNDTASYMKVSINGTEYDMDEVDPADTNTTDGKNYTFNMTGFPIGTHTYKFLASDGTGTSETSQLSFSVDVSNHPPTLTDAEVKADSFVVGEKVFFNVTYTDPDNNASTFNYVQIGGSNKTMFKVDSGDSTATDGIKYTYNTTLLQGNHSYRFFASDGTFEVNTAAQNVTIYPKTYFTGDRIWDGERQPDAQSSKEYTWDAKSFSGFFYDLESGLSSESLTISNIRSTLTKGDIIYKTSPVESDFERSEWDKFNVIGFMAEEYFAGYTANTSIDGVEEVSLISSGQLSKILINNDEKESVYAGSSVILENGYELNIVEVDMNGDKVFVTLTKDGDELDSTVISGGSDYIYKEDLGDADDVIILAVHFDNIFQGGETTAVFVEGIFQISDEYLELESGDSYGDMEIIRIDDDLIEMENDGSVSLSKGKSINLMGKIKLLVADNKNLRFAPVVDMSEPGTYELRGTVAEGDELLTWTPLNFEGFYYDIDEGIQTETLELRAISGKSIDSGDLIYTSTPASVEFERPEWGKFNVMGFMAEKYFAGYTAATDIDGVSALNLISDGQLSKVLVDEDSKVSVFSGSELVLEEGYTLQIVEVDVNGESVLINLYKDGDEVDTGIVSADADYVFEKDLGDADDVPIIIIHFNEVFRGSESNAVFVEGMFQISEDYITLETGDNYGDMEIDSFGTSIVMSNDKSISLNKDKEIELMDNVMIKVANSDTLRYYPFVEVKTAASETLNVKLSQSTVVEGDEITISVNARGASIADATIKVEGKTIGTTASDGTLVHTFSEAGTFEITAERDDYATGSEDIEVIGKDDETKKMSIEVSPDEVYEGTSMTIFVLKAIGSDGISGATVTFDGKIIGTTDNDGTISYTATEAGTHKIVASKSGLLEAEYDLRVDELAAKFEFSNLVITPLEIKQGKEATISVDVVNTGTAAGDYTVDLKVDDVVVDSQFISLSVGNSTTLEFPHVEEEPGTYEVKVGGLTTTYEVFEKSGTIWYVLGAIALAAIGGIAYLFTAGGWTVEIAQAKVAEAIESIKELVGNIR